MKKNGVWFSIVALCVLLLTACGNKSTLPPEKIKSKVETNDILSNMLPSISEVVDYVEVVSKSDSYNGETVTVAGEIAEFSKNFKSEFRFRDGLEAETARTGFAIHLAQRSKPASELYSVGEHVLVQGVWNSRWRYLEAATVLAEGSEAEKYVNILRNHREIKTGNSQQTLPIVDYMEICSNLEKYEGTRIRTAGQIQAVTKNLATYHISFSFRDRQTNGTCITFSLKGCPQEMQDLCREDDFVIISGVVGRLVSKPMISDCIVECVGETAKQAAEESYALWFENYQKLRTDYIETCSKYSYEELARYPNQYIGNRISISGTVLQVDTVWGENVVLLNVGQNRLVYINYTGKQYQDPEILAGDRITFYGETAGTETYTTVLGADNTIPLVIAQYSSINCS